MANGNTTREMLRRYNQGEIDLNEKEKEMLAMRASQEGLKFDVESKPLRKAAFDFADTFAFGMLPNEWRPRSAGEDIYGETGLDKLAGGVGSIGGLATGVGALVKGATKLSAAVKSAMAKRRAENIANSVMKGTVVPSGNPQLISAGPRLLTGGPRQLTAAPKQIAGVPRQLPPVPRQLPAAQRQLPSLDPRRISDNMSLENAVRFLGQRGTPTIQPNVSPSELATMTRGRVSDPLYFLRTALGYGVSPALARASGHSTPW